MPSAAISSFGTLLKIGDGGGTEVFTTIAEVVDIKPPALTLETEDVTNQSSTAGWRERLGSILDAGDVTFTIQYVPTAATHNASTGLIRDMKNRTRRNFKVVFPDSTEWAFAALVTKFAPNAPVKGKLSADVTLSSSGQPTLA